MKKLFAATLAALLALSMTACGGAPAAAPAEGSEGGAAAPADVRLACADAPKLDAGSNFAVQIGTSPETIDPAKNSAIDGANMIMTFFEPLLIVDQDNKVQPGQAEKWEVSEDGMVWTFTLRDDLKWSNGEPLTAEDFVYTMNRIADPGTAAPYAETAVGMIKGFGEGQLAVSAPDAKTLVVELAYPCSYFDKMAAFAALSPVNKAAVEAGGDGWTNSPETFVCNGPYRMKDWVLGEKIVCEKNPNYKGGWDPAKIVTQEITFLLMEDANASYTAYQTGAAQLIKDVPTEEIESLSRAEDGGDFSVATTMGTYYLSFNTQKAPFDNPLVRKALSLAVDRDYVANTLMQGTYKPAYNICGPGITDADGKDFMENSKPGFIPEEREAREQAAKDALAEAGYPNGEGFPTITYTTNDAGYHRPLAEYLQNEYKQVLNIDMKIEIVEWKAFTPMRRAGDYEMARNGWVMDYNDASNMLELFQTENGNNDGKVSLPEVDAALEASRVGDAAEHFAQLHKVEDTLMENYAMIPVAYYSDFWLQNPQLKGTWHSPYGYWYLQYGYIE